MVIKVLMYLYDLVTFLVSYVSETSLDAHTDTHTLHHPFEHIFVCTMVSSVFSVVQNHAIKLFYLMVISCGSREMIKSYYRLCDILTEINK